MVISLKQRIPNWPITALVAGVLVLVVVLFTFSPAPAAPTISWTPSSVVETVSQGQTKTTTVSFTSEEDLEDVIVWIVPELESYVSADPASFFSISAGVATTITLTFSAAIDAPLGTFEGTLQLKDNSGKSKKTYAQPLPITIGIWQSVAEKGLIVGYPQNWQLNQAPLDLGGPIALNNFGNAYQQGGIVPEGGAEIDITTTPLPTSPLNDVIAEDLQGATIESTEETLVAGEAGTKVVYTASFISTLAYKNVVVYVPHGTLLYKFFLSYHEGDSLEAQFLANFQEILNTIQFTQ